MKRGFWSPAFLLFIVVTIAYSLKGEETGRTEFSEEKQEKGWRVQAGLRMPARRTAPAPS